MKKLDMRPYRKVRCVYSTENAIRTQSTDRVADRTQTENQSTIKGSLMQVTAVFGCTLASMVIKDLR
jgi:tRNA A37 threonylcarbamoyladenosine dehydratase